MLPLGMALYTIINDVNQDLKTIEKEINGLEYIRALIPIFEAVPQHRGMRNALLNGNSSFNQAILEKNAEIDRLMAGMDKLDIQQNNTLQTGNKWQEIRQLWKMITTGANPPILEKSWALHTELIGKLIALILHAESTSEILIASNNETHFIITGVLEHLPLEIELIAQVRGLGAGIAATSAITSHDRFLLSNMVGRIRLLFSETRHALHAFNKNPNAQKNMEAMLQKHAARLDYFLTLLEKEFLSAEHISIQPKKYFLAGTRAISSSVRILHSTVNLTKKLLVVRAASLSEKKTRLQMSHLQKSDGY